MTPVWIVDDDASIRWVLERALQRAQLPCRLFNSAHEVMRALQSETPQVLVSDIRMPGDSGLQLLEHVKARLPQMPVIIMTAHSDLDSAVSAFQGGAFDYLAKPFDVHEATALIQRAVNESAGSQPGDSAGAQPSMGMLGQAPAMQELFRAIGRLSQSTVTVLVTGESGTGKELVARALHTHSPRANKAFVALNAAAIPKDLLESELFGHERGAFTGAQTQRQGRFEQAEGGTLFLDEIGDMPFDLQTRLLRVLSDGHFYRVGGHQPLKADVRVIAATHQDLEKRVAEGLFREDLFHRLNVIRLRLPPLRERTEDIEGLTRHFLERAARQMKSEVRRLSPAAMQALRDYPFPGNIRQLENLCQWISVMAPGQSVEVNDLPPEFRAGALPSVGSGEIVPASPPVSHPLGPVTALPEMSWSERLNQALDEAFMQATANPALAGAVEMSHWQDIFERTVYEAALRHTRGRRIEAAVLLGVGRNTITRKIASLGLSVKDLVD
ncbi:MAG: nitrogen regulation protein NR(I) [Betaproteobacteria bacterium]|nr:nitrogen regulation protein NR(I) [Betaproteobacteria bacterium]